MSNCSKENLIESEFSTTSNETIKSTRKCVESVLQSLHFQYELCLLIHGSKKSLDELVTKIYKLLEKKFFVEEKVYRIDGSGEMYTVVKDVSNRFRTRYKIQSTSMTTPEVVNFSEIVRAHHISKADLNVLVDLLACLQNGCWYVRRPYAERLGIAGKPDVEITIRDAKEPTTSQMICIILGFFILIIVFVDLFVTYIVLGNLSTEDNAELSKESIALVAKMNRTTLDHYFKELVANEMINAVDHPLAAEGIAHMFWFESNLKNRTTLDEYVDRMKPTQQSIFYAYDHSKSDIEQMSNVQSLLESGIEVLFVTSPLDKRVIDRIDMFRGKLFVDTKRLISIKNETAILAL